MTSACASIASISRERPSMKPCFSFAAWNSAFSRRSPWARASSMSCTFFGRSTSLRCLSSSRRARYPRGVMGTRSAILELLQRRDAEPASLELADGGHGGARPRQGGEIGQPAHESGPPDGEGVLDGLRARRGVDDHVDGAVEHAVDDVRAALAHLVHALDLHAR